MANTYLTRTLGTPTNSDICTISVWLKIASTNATHGIAQQYSNSTNNFRFRIIPDGRLQIFQETLGASEISLLTTQVFRDTSAWYHIVIAFDTTQGTASNRVKLYVNGSQISDFDAETYPSQNTDIRYNINSLVQEIGKQDTSNYFDGSMSHFHFTDGYAYDASAFGQYDANGVWTIKTSPSVTYGTNGFFILKDGNSVTDQSGNGNNFTVAGGTLTNTEDNPSNVFATLNFLNKEIGGATLSNGNNKLVTGSGTPYTGKTNATLGASTGKYYWEVKPTTDPSTTFHICAIVGEDFDINNSTTYLNANGTEGKSYISFKMANGNIATNFTGTRVDTSYGNAVSTNDIIGVALDLDNGKIFFSINGTWQNSGDPVTGTNPASSDVGSLGGDIVFPAFGDGNYATSATLEINFGNGYFGTTAVASAGTNASGIGIFEYDVPTGYTALSTKGLNL